MTPAIKVKKLLELLGATVGDWDVTVTSEGLLILNLKGDVVGKINFEDDDSALVSVDG